MNPTGKMFFFVKKLGAFFTSPRLKTVTTPASNGTLDGITKGWSAAAAADAAVAADRDLDLVETDSCSVAAVDAVAGER